jgi:Domain of unknown function (DUF4920)
MPRITTLALAILLVAVPLSAAGPAVYGAAVTVEKPTPIAALLDAPAEHAGRLVRVEGKVSGVCAMAGCWMELEDEARRRVRIKVEDGVIVFPADALGRKAVAQGTVRLETLSRERYVAWRKHLAEETGASFDEAAVGDGPFQVVEIAGSGASIGD